MDVVLLRWPLEQERRERLEREGRLRLLLVEGGCPAPQCTDDSRGLDPGAGRRGRRPGPGRGARRLATAPIGDDLPELDHDGVLRFGGGWVSLPPVEARLMSALIERYGAVVSRDAARRARAGPRARRVATRSTCTCCACAGASLRSGLAIKTVRSRGYLLEAEAVGAPVVAGFSESDAKEA